jgi:hypothetical protein
MFTTKKRNPESLIKTPDLATPCLIATVPVRTGSFSVDFPSGTSPINQKMQFHLFGPPTTSGTPSGRSAMY